MQYMPTNDVLHHVLRLLQLHKDKEFVLEIFESAGVPGVTRAKLKAWNTKCSTPQHPA